MPRGNRRGISSGRDDNGITMPPGVKELSLDMNQTELCKSLKKCCRVFSELEQGNEQIMSEYKSFVEYLVQDEMFLQIKDPTCAVFLGCLLTDIFRVYAPNNPFQTLSDRIRDIFMFVTKQLALLADPKDSSYHKAHHILSNLATFKCYSICMDLDLESANDIFVDLFRTLLSTVNSGHDNNLKGHMLDVMTFVLTDTASLSASSPQLIELLLSSLLDQSQRMNPSAYELAKELLRRNASSLEQPLLTYFQNVAIANRGDGGGKMNDGEMSKVAAQWDKLIPILYKISRNLLLNTLPQFELKLKIDNPKERLQTVRLFATMFAEKESDLAIQYPKLWQALLGRFNDIVPEVRSVCVNFYCQLLTSHGADSALCKETFQYFKPRRHDMDEGVRLAVVCAIRNTAVRDLKLVSDDLLDSLCDRRMDKKLKVREGAIRAMADIYKKYATGPDSLRYNVKRIHKFRNSLLRVYYHNNCEDVILLERMLISSLVPYKLAVEERMKLLLELYVTVDDMAAKAIVQIIKNQRILQSALNDVLKSFDIEDEKERSEAIWPKAVTLAAHLPGSTQQVRENVKKFIRIAYQDGRVRQLLAYIVGEEYTSKKIETAVRDLLKKLEGDGAPRQVRLVVQQILERAVILPIIIDSEALKTLFSLVTESLDNVSDIDELNGEEAQIRAIGLLRLLAQLCPHLFTTQDCYEDLLGFIRRSRDPHVVDDALHIFQQTSRIIEQRFPEIRSALLPELKLKAKQGTGRQAKRAVFCIAEMSSIKESALLSIFEYGKEALQSSCEVSVDGSGDSSKKQVNDDMIKYETLFTSLGCIAQVLPQQVSQQLRNVVASIVVKQVIMKTTLTTPVPAASISRRATSHWCEKKAIGRESRAKIAGMKCMMRWLRGMRSNDSDVCGSTLRLLQHILHNNGDLMKTGNIPRGEMCHLRLQAASCIVKIAQIGEYRRLLTPELYQELAMLVNDPELEVRRTFINKLYRALYLQLIDVSFLSLFAMISQETNKAQRGRGSDLYVALVKRFRDFNNEKGLASLHRPSLFTPEYMLPYLIYLLADDPDFVEGISKKSLGRIKDCVQFALDPLLTKNHAESFGFIKRLADNVKRTKNADTPDDDQRNENIYAVCDLVVLYVIQRSAQYAVGVIEPDDSTVIRFIPTRLFTAPCGPENNKYYLPREFYVNLKKSLPSALISASPKRTVAKKTDKPVASNKKIAAATAKKSVDNQQQLKPSPLATAATTRRPLRQQKIKFSCDDLSDDDDDELYVPNLKRAQLQPLDISGGESPVAIGLRSRKLRRSEQDGNKVTVVSQSVSESSTTIVTSPKSGSGSVTSSGTTNENSSSFILTPPDSEQNKKDDDVTSESQSTALSSPQRTSGRKRKLPRRLEDSPPPPSATSSGSFSPVKRSKKQRNYSSSSSSPTKNADSTSVATQIDSDDSDDSPLSSLVSEKTTSQESSASRSRGARKASLSPTKKTKTKPVAATSSRSGTRSSKRNR